VASPLTNAFSYKTLTTDPHEAWKQVEKVLGVVKFLGGERVMPKKNEGVRTYVTYER
jgi:hypothetical protein